MRDPTIRVDPDLETAIEETCRYLERYMPFKPHPGGRACDARATAAEVEDSDMPEWAKTVAMSALFQQTKKRERGKPKIPVRDMAIRQAAGRLVVLRGYIATRNEEMRDRQSAASIVHQALQRLGVKMSEKRVNALVLEFCRDVSKWPRDFVLRFYAD